MQNMQKWQTMAVHTINDTITDYVYISVEPSVVHDLKVSEDGGMLSGRLHVMNNRALVDKVRTWFVSL